MGMQAQREQSEEKTIQELQRQVDELTTANLLLQDQLARKEQYIAMIAHELRSPLSPIINYAQMLARQASAPPKKEQDPAQRSGAILRHTNIIISQARRLSRLVNDLLDASRLTSGQFTLIREHCDIVALAGETIEQLRPVAPYHTLVLNTSNASISNSWDGGRLQQALGNLLDNAIKYSDESSTITVGIKASQESVHVSVHNQGSSIPSADSTLLFRPYMRLSAASGRQGSGLGLFITKSIIEAHGGTLQLEPHGEDAAGERQQGTTFSFDLPLALAGS